MAIDHPQKGCQCEVHRRRRVKDRLKKRGDPAHKAKASEWNKKNREKHAARAKAWRIKNRPRYLALMRRFRRKIRLEKAASAGPEAMQKAMMAEIERDPRYRPCTPHTEVRADSADQETERGKHWQDPAFRERMRTRRQGKSNSWNGTGFVF